MCSVNNYLIKYKLYRVLYSWIVFVAFNISTRYECSAHIGVLFCFLLVTHDTVCELLIIMRV